MAKALSVLAVSILCASGPAVAQAPRMDRLLYGVAYYDEYMPYDRLEQDIHMMKEAGINVVRIAESTWSTVEPQDGTFDFTHIDRVLDAMHRASIHVIVGTPTYAVPTWLVRKYPDVLAITPRGPNQYGPRQNMDITNVHFRLHAERVIRRMMEHVRNHPAIIGYQVDNETKHYQTAGPAVQAAEGQRRGQILDGASHADDGEGDCPVRSPRLEPVRRGHGEHLWEGSGHVRRVHAERRSQARTSRARRFATTSTTRRAPPPSATCTASGRISSTTGPSRRAPRSSCQRGAC